MIAVEQDVVDGVVGLIAERGLAPGVLSGVIQGQHIVVADRFEVPDREYLGTLC